MWWSKKKASHGWSAVDTGPDGIFGVSVRAAETSGGKLQVMRCGTVPEMEFTAAAISRLAKVIEVQNFAWTLPLQRGNYKLLVLPTPAVKPAEMANSVRWSLATVIDEPVEDISLDWMPIPTQKYLPQRQQHIYVIVVNKAHLAQSITPFRRANVALDAVDIRETGQRNIASCFEKSGEALGMLVVDTQGVSITFSFEGELYLDRYIEMPLTSIVTGSSDSRGKLFEHITLQMQRSLDFLQRTLPFLHVGRILIAPLPAPIALRDHLAENIGVPVEIVDLASVFDFSRTPELAGEESQARYFGALGAALRGRALAA